MRVLSINTMCALTFAFILSGCMCSTRIVYEDYKVPKDGHIDTTDRWFEECAESGRFWTRGIIKGREVACTIVNAGIEDLVFVVPDNGFSYAVRYRDVSGEIQTFESPVRVGFDGPRTIGVLTGQDSRYFSLEGNHGTHFKIRLPSDCVALMAVSVDFDYIGFSEFSGAKDVSEFLQKLYSRQFCLKIRLTANTDEGMD